jgi:hypothetical protein
MSMKEWSMNEGRQFLWRGLFLFNKTRSLFTCSTAEVPWLTVSTFRVVITRNWSMGSRAVAIPSEFAFCSVMPCYNHSMRELHFVVLSKRKMTQWYLQPIMID